MPPVHFSVSQVRVAASCPRILYFDAEKTARTGDKTVTRIWKATAGDEAGACGSLFHATVEKFNSQAATDASVRALLAPGKSAAEVHPELTNLLYWNYVDHAILFEKTGAQQARFMTALRTYAAELADILVHARSLGKPAEEVLDELFGDRRRRVDVTFRVGPEDLPVHVSGQLDYVFYDWRTAHHRILDWKLTPAQETANDLFQVCVYALMHHSMHGTKPDVGVLYLHPQRTMHTKDWSDVWAERHKVFDLLASMSAWLRYDESSGQGLRPPGEPIYCAACRWRGECEERLGPKAQGDRLQSLPSATSLPSNQDLCLGQHAGDGLSVVVPPSALCTHVTVVGAAGSGKTWLAKVVAEEAILQGVPVLAVDPQGDLVQFLRPRHRDEIPDADRCRYDRFWERVEPRIFTPGSSHGIRLCLNPLRSARANELTGLEDAQRRAEESASILATIAGNLVALARSTGEVDSQQTFLLHILRRLTEREGESVTLAELTAALTDPESYGIEDSDAFVKKSERERLARKLNGLMHGPSANLFKEGMALDVDRLRRPVTPGKVPLNVLYLNALAGDDAKQFFVASLAIEIYRWMVTSGVGGAGPSLLFYLDEARDYLPAGGRKPPAKEALLRLFMQGRKYGVGCLLCTQSPRSVDYNVFGNCSTKLIGRLESAQDVERVAEWFGVQGSAPQWLRGRQAAEKGTFVGRWPEMPRELEGEAFKSRVLFSEHSGAWSPERVEQHMRDDPVRRAFADETIRSS